MATVDPKTLPVDSGLAKQLRAHVNFLAGPELKGRKPGTAGHRTAADYITARFQEIGLQPLPSLNRYGQPVSDELGDNLIGARLSAGGETDSERESRWVLIGAHYDHLGESLLGNVYAGADDNAAAVAILMELARALPALPNHPVLFVAFNTEEPPFIRTPLMGSQVFVDHLPSEIGSPANLHAVIIMDLMGGAYWEPLKDTIFAVGAEKSPGLYRRIRAASVQSSSLSTHSSALSTAFSILPVGMHLLEELPVVGRHPFSDYDAFRNASVPFLFLSAGRTPHYHQPTDLPDTLHYERMATTVTWLDQVVRLIDQDREPYRFEPDRIELADELETLHALVEQASHKETQIPGTSLFSRYRLKLDARWLGRISAESIMKSEDRDEHLRRMEKISIRVQCLLANFYGCGLF
ncbi:MAG: M28 family metallopeptidase [Nitrospiraceae bacterium]